MSMDGLSLLTLLLAFLGGLVSFVSPCVLPLVPIYLGHLSGVSVYNGTIAASGETFKHAMAFVGGFSVLFISLGATAGLLGGFAGGYQGAISKGAGIVLIVLGVHTTGVLRLPGLGKRLGQAFLALDRFYYQEWRYPGSLGQKAGYWRSLGVGGAFAVGWVPCITPILGAILTLAYSGAGDMGSAWETAGQSAVLLAFYTIGMGIPFLMTGALMGRVMPALRRLQRYMPLVNVASGVLLVAVGLLVYFNLVTALNRYFNFLPYVSF